MRYLLGVDIGTTGTKTVLFSEFGDQIGCAYRDYPCYTPHSGYCEQCAQDWWNAVTETVRIVCKNIDHARDVIALSLSTQGGTIVPVNAMGEPLCNAIVWNDARCKEERKAFAHAFGDDYIYGSTGWHLRDGLPLLVVRWLRENRPEIYQKAAMYLSVADYIAFKMTGIAAVDFSNAGINQFCNLENRQYDDRLLKFAGIHTTQLPRLIASGECVGFLQENAAKEMGLHPGTILVSGAHDQYAVALGSGAMTAGDILIGSGTCWVITALTDQPSFASGLSQSVTAVPGLWGSLASLTSGGVCLDWFRKKLVQDERHQPMSYERINTEALRKKAAEDGLFFYPFASMAHTKGGDNRAALVGLDLTHDCFHIARAVMEGVVFETAWMLEQFTTNQLYQGLVFAGGASKSELWCQLVADTMNLPVYVPQLPDLACVGAAILAGVGSGVYKSVADGYQHLAVSNHVVLPQAEQVKIYRNLFKQYKAGAQQLGTRYHATAAYSVQKGEPSL